MLHEALNGGGPASRRMDPLGKGLAQILLEMAVRVPASWRVPACGPTGRDPGVVSLPRTRRPGLR